MGTINCSHFPDKQLKDECHVSNGEYSQVDHFCTIQGPSGDKYRQSVCRQFGPEWGFAKRSGNCNFNSCDRMNAMKAGCCKSPAKCCGIQGTGASCKRVAYYGDPVECCLRNSVCKQPWTNANDCKDNKYGTCSDGKNGTVDNRTLTGTGCHAPMRDYFIGKGVSIQTCVDRWLDSSSRGARYFIYRVIHEGANCLDYVDKDKLKIDPKGLEMASSMIVAFVDRFNRDFSPLKIPSTKWSPTYHRVQDVLYEMALKYPAVMDGALYFMCGSLSEEELLDSTDSMRLCGCHLKDEEYSKYSISMGLNKECSPLCSPEGTIPSLDYNGGIKTCTQSVCAINNVDAVISQSKVGNISIQQLCSHCSSKDSCMCVVDGVDLKVSRSDISGTVEAVKQICSDSTCTITDPSNSSKKISVPCDGPEILYYQYLKRVRERESKSTAVAITLCLFLTCLVAVLVMIRRM